MIMEVCRNKGHATRFDILFDSLAKDRASPTCHRRNYSQSSISSVTSSRGPLTPGSATYSVDCLSPRPTTAYYHSRGMSQDSGAGWVYGTDSGMDGDSEQDHAGSGQGYYEESYWGSSSDPRHLTSDGYCCLVPGCKAVPFKRNADLDRHYKHKHRPDERKEAYYCDYPKCSRRDSPFYRRDHFRDHLRDYHKEDIAKRGRPVHTHWVESCNVKKEWWRCTRCLSRVMVEADGFDCPGCNTSCDSNRAQTRKSP